MRPIILHANTYAFAPGEEIRSGPVLSRMQLWCLEGRGEVAINDSTHVLEPGFVALLPWGFRIRYRAARRHPCVLAGIHLIPRAADLEPMPFSRVAHSGQALAGLHDDPDPVFQGLRTYRWSNTDPWWELSQYVVGVFTRAAPEVVEQRRLAEQVIAEWRQVQATSALRDADRTWQAVTAAIAAHPERPMSLDHMARLVGCSTATLSRRARAAFACSPTVWMQRLRIDLAKQRLRDEPAQTLESLAQDLGFCDAFYFSRIFKRHTGLSPRQWRQRERLF